jgi:anthranilate phosphoribosyltransferase
MSTPTAPPWYVPTLETLLAGNDLTAVQMCTVMQGLMGGACGEVETAALLVALRMKGETAEELAAAAAVLREYCVHFDPGRDGVLDTCGTGGDGAGTFNISTAAALVVAGAGVPVVKHGNRAMSGRVGSADVLAELGVAVECDPAQARRCLDEAGMCFCLASRFHPCTRHVGAVRRALGVRTLFNCLGPLANPARAPFQLLGVGRAEWLDLMAGALTRLGVRRAFVVCGHDGLDEVTLSGPTSVREVRGRSVQEAEWTPEDFGLPPCKPDELRVAGAKESAALIRRVLAGDEGPAGRVVRANAAAALLAAGRVSGLREGVRLAAESIQSGRAAAVLDRLGALAAP